MEKIKKHVFGKDIYLLGKDKDGTNYWLQEASWDCDWYWGFGYIETYTNNKNPERSKDIESHNHFNNLFLKKDIFDSFKNFFEESTLNNDEIWKLLGYMKEFYVMKEYSELLKWGNHITSKAENITEQKNKIENINEYNRINKILMSELFEKIYKLLTI